MDLISIEILNNDVLRKEENNELLNVSNAEESLKENENGEIQEEEEEQDDLTNLAWLTELRNQRHNSILYSGEFEYETVINTGLGTGTGTTQLINAEDDYNTVTTTTTLQNDMPKLFQKQQQQHLQQNSIDSKQQPSQKPTIKRPTPMERFETFCKKVKRLVTNSFSLYYHYC